jgi:diguanylate cyclase (GGDEF)-like protein
LSIFDEREKEKRVSIFNTPRYTGQSALIEHGAGGDMWERSVPTQQTVPSLVPGTVPMLYTPALDKVRQLAPAPPAPDIQPTVQPIQPQADLMRSFRALEATTPTPEQQKVVAQLKTIAKPPAVDMVTGVAPIVKPPEPQITPQMKMQMDKVLKDENHPLRQQMLKQAPSEWQKAFRAFGRTSRAIAENVFLALNLGVKPEVLYGEKGILGKAPMEPQNIPEKIGAGIGQILGSTPWFMFPQVSVTKGIPLQPAGMLPLSKAAMAKLGPQTATQAIGQAAQKGAGAIGTLASLEAIAQKMEPKKAAQHIGLSTAAGALFAGGITAGKIGLARLPQTDLGKFVQREILSTKGYKQLGEDLGFTADRGTGVWGRYDKAGKLTDVVVETRTPENTRALKAFDQILRTYPGYARSLGSAGEASKAAEQVKAMLSPAATPMPIPAPARPTTPALPGAPAIPALPAGRFIPPAEATVTPQTPEEIRRAMQEYQIAQQAERERRAAEEELEAKRQEKEKAKKIREMEKRIAELMGGKPTAKAPAAPTTSPMEAVKPEGEGITPVEAGKAAVEAEATPEAGRRTNLALRTEINKLSPEEKDEVIRDLRARVFTDELTGLKNRAAYMMDEKQPVQAIIDLDNLKWVNDNIGHGAGDTLIKSLAAELPEGSYRLSGDEFVVQGQSREELAAALSGIEARLNEQVLELAGDKQAVSKKGIGFSYGIGETLDKAETALQEHKKARLEAGKRAERGEVPPGITEKGKDVAAKEPWEMTREEYNNQGPIYVHETDSPVFDKFDISKVGTGQGEAWLGPGIYLQRKGTFKIETYGKNKIEATLKPDAKIFHIEDTPDSPYRDNFVQYAVERGIDGGLAKMREDEGLSLKNLLPRDILKRRPNVVEQLKRDGYDGLEQDGELVVYNPDVLTVKREHKATVADALSQGKPVPPEVLKDYPELKPAEKPTPAKATSPAEVKPETPTEAAPEPTKAEEVKPAEPTPVSSGKTVTAKTERGTAIEAKYAVVEADSLVASHDTRLKENPAYPKELQPRDRTRMASESQINRIAQKLEPEFLGESPKVSEGAPIVGKDGIVESGNARTIALQRLYEQKHKNAELYKNWIKDNAEKFGIDKETLETAKNPVLVRIRQTDIDRVKFTQEANEQAVAAMSASEQAQADAKRLTGRLMEVFAPSETGEILTPANRQFVGAFFSEVVSEAEKGKYITKDGSISQEGLTRIRNAVFAKAYGDTGAIEKLAESTDVNVKNQINAMLIAAPRIMRIKDAIDKDELYNLDISPELAAAMNKLSYLRETGQTVDTYLRQMSFVEDLSPLAKEVLYVFDKHKRSSKRIASILQAYADSVELAGNPNQQTIFAQNAPSKEEIWTRAVRKAEGLDEEALQTTIFQSQGMGDKGTGQAGEKAAEGTGKAEEKLDEVMTELGEEVDRVVGDTNIPIGQSIRIVNNVTKASPAANRNLLFGRPGDRRKG